MLGRYSIILPKDENLWDDEERYLWNNTVLPAFWVIGNSSASIFEVTNTDFGREFLRTTPVLVKGTVDDIKDSVFVDSDEIHIGFDNKRVKCHFESSEYNQEDLENIKGNPQFILGTVFKSSYNTIELENCKVIQNGVGQRIEFANGNIGSILLREREDGTTLVNMSLPLEKLFSVRSASAKIFGPNESESNWKGQSVLVTGVVNEVENSDTDDVNDKVFISFGNNEVECELKGSVYTLKELEKMRDNYVTVTVQGTVSDLRRGAVVLVDCVIE